MTNLAAFRSGHFNLSRNLDLCDEASALSLDNDFDLIISEDHRGPKQIHLGTNVLSRPFSGCGSWRAQNWQLPSRSKHIEDICTRERLARRIGMKPLATDLEIIGRRRRRIEFGGHVIL